MLKNQKKRKNISVDDILTQLDESDIDFLSTDDEYENDDIECVSEPTKSSSDFELVFNDTGESDAIPSTSSSTSAKQLKEKSKKKLLSTTATTSAIENAVINWTGNYFISRNIEWEDQFHIGDKKHSPLEILMKYFPNELFEKFATESNIYCMRETGTNLDTTPTEIQQFFGMNILMGNVSLQRIRMYWQPTTRIDRVADIMPVNRFFKIRQYIHVVSAKEPPENNNDKFWKIAPVIAAVRKACLQLPREEFSSIDEQMIPLTGRMPAKQIMKSKLTPVGIKNWVMCGKSGRVLDFEIHQGARTPIPLEYKTLGLRDAVVLRLSETIPKDKNYNLCFGNYFTGIPFIRELKKRDILSIGTLRSNRMCNCSLLTEKKMKSGPRGGIDFKVSAEKDICVSRWLDNGVVTLASTFAGVEAIDQVRRWSEFAEERNTIDRTHSIGVNNNYMGGVDKIDYLISLHRIKAKTRKWPVRMFFHFLDLAVANSWMEYRDFELEHGIPKSNISDLLAFRNEVGRALTTGTVPARSATRPRSEPNSIGSFASPPQKKAKKIIMPVHDVRYDFFGHWPECIDGLGQNCKLEGCEGRSRVKCVKCNVSLCLNKNKNCFTRFHKK